MTPLYLKQRRKVMNHLWYKSKIKMFPEPEEGTIQTTSPLRVKGLGSYYPARWYSSTPHRFGVNTPVFILGRKGITLLISLQSD